jgi:ectoine hydroxylase-related dioxygenase (phytanoyl-CoA dioxygenase family)
MTRPVAVSETDIASYHRDGAVLLKGVLDPEELRLLAEGVDQVYADPGERSSVVRSPEGQGETLVLNYPTARSAALRALMERGVIAQVAGKLMRTPQAQLVFEQIFYKTPGRIVPTPWHQDTPFLRLRGYDMCRVWLTADYSPSDITVQVVRGSHRWNVVFSPETGERDPVVKSDEKAGYSNDNLGDPGLPPPPDVARYRDSFDILTFEVEPGDALVFQGNMLHGAQGRDSWERPRRAFATMWGGPQLKYHEPHGKAFPPPGSLREHPVPDGAPIGEHPEVFPVGWRAA